MKHLCPEEQLPGKSGTDKQEQKVQGTLGNLWPGTDGVEDLHKDLEEEDNVEVSLLELYCNSSFQEAVMDPFSSETE